ncbi:hypothetical protein Aca07nite_76530 [Actinoplanes capillaceus]|uniref:DUF2637 domain-containing protein n=1 Tax=Actinoplanes campanulatus TaxID=113559 RepID=A0ABQ3WW06_9ACTN|nr:DUF2637 domain-containing protein [Actinoplanes capillaceus]GID50378.1 hypothetical protein Aca07nite_76530 [Actinoplanes capillaceus]
MSSRLDTMIRSMAGVTVVGLAGISGAISYSHMKHLAQLHGETGWRAHMFPLSVDGIEIVASLVLLADKRAGRRSGWLPWTALVAGTAASLAANIAVGGSDWIGRAVSGWPALAMLVAVKLLSGLLDHPLPRRDGQASSGAVPDNAVRAPDGSEIVPLLERSADDTTEQSGVRKDRSEPIPADAADPTADHPSPSATDPSSAKGDIVALLPAAHSARRTLLTSGRRLTREALARQLRADGWPVSNARASALLKVLANTSSETSATAAVAGIQPYHLNDGAMPKA